MSLTRGQWAALVALVVGYVCLILEPYVPWLIGWPKAWTLPMSDWIGVGLEAVLNWMKPAARGFSALMEWPMAGANWVLTQTPWVFVVACAVALGWYLGGLGMAGMAAAGLAFVLASGYWIEAMNTLALVAVSVPLALILGLGIGVLANEVPRVKSAVQAVLDVMQTVPTFAYLTPLLLLFGFGPVVGLIASAIYAAPPMARNVILGLERTDPEMREAAVMAGAHRWTQLVQVELPAARTQVMIGVNQCLMAALSMVIIAAVIGGFNDIGWEVLLTMRKAQFGQAFLAGLVIVVFAILIDRMSARLATDRARFDQRVVWALLAAGVVLAALLWGRLPNPSEFAILDPVADAVDASVGAFTAANGAGLDAIKNGAMFYALLPLRIGLDQAVLPFTWGFMWTPAMSLWLFAAGFAGAALLWLSGWRVAALLLPVLVLVIETGITNLPWPFVLIAIAALGWAAGGRQLSLLVLGLLVVVLLSGLWDRALLSLYLSGTAVLACVIVGGALGLWSALSDVAWAVIRPICDMLQTIPLFVFLIPVLMFFQIGEFSAFLAICAYAVVPMIRYTRAGLVETPPDLIEAAVASGATRAQTLWNLRLPYAAPTILLGLNQTILYAFAMLVIAALIGTTGLGQSIYLALGQADVGLGVAAGAAMAILALIADRLVQGFAEKQRAALGL